MFHVEHQLIEPEPNVAPPADYGRKAQEPPLRERDGLKFQVWWEGDVAVVHLLPSALKFAAEQGIACAESVIAHKRKAHTDLSQDPVALKVAHIRGKYGELAVALLHDLPLPSPGTWRKVADCHPFNVRATASNPPRLVIRPQDSPQYPMMLVDVRHVPFFRVLGWIWPAEANEHPEWLDAPGHRKPAVFVPVECLPGKAWDCPEVADDSEGHDPRT